MESINQIDCDRRIIEELDDDELRSDDGLELVDTDHCDSDDEVASLDHVSEYEDEVLFYSQKNLQSAGGKKKNKCKKEESIGVRDDSVKPNMKNDSTATDLTVFMSEYEKSDNDDADPMYDSEDSQCVDEGKKNNWPVFDPDTPWDNQEPVKGMLFADYEELKHCITNYAVANGRNVKFKKLSKDKVISVCSKGCNWRLSGSKHQMENSFQVKSYKREHTRGKCLKNFRVKLVTSKWLAKEYANDIRSNPRWKLVDFQAAVLAKHKIRVTKVQCYRARKLGLSQVESVLIEHYAKLWDYREELVRSNPGSTIVLESIQNLPESPPMFDKVYICFDAIARNWINACRPIIGLDGCFLKSFCKGQLLCAVGRDGNNNMFPIAWAVVESESTETWTWFLKLLNDDIGFDDGHGLTFISDQQKGLLNGLKTVFRYAEHRNCARHIYANFRKRYSGVHLRNLFWTGAKSGTHEEFLNVLDAIKKGLLKKVSIPMDILKMQDVMKMMLLK